MDVKEIFEQGYDKQVLGYYLEAIEDYNEAIELDKDFERAYIQRACCKMQLKDYNSALSDYKIAIGLNSNDPITFLNMGVANYYLENDEALEYLDKAIELDSENMPEAYFMRGLIAFAKENYDKAILELSRAIDIDSTWSAFYLLRGTAYRDIEEYDKALEDFYKVKELVPDHETIDDDIEHCLFILQKNR